MTILSLHDWSAAKKMMAGENLEDFFQSKMTYLKTNQLMLAVNHFLPSSYCSD